MDRSIRVENDNRPPITSPGWPYYLMALAGVVLLIGPTLMALWP